MTALNDIGLLYGTDKASSGHNYLQYYEKFFEPMREQPLDILEIGIWEGASLAMWQQYFTTARIFGIDIDDKTQYNDQRIMTFICDQGNPQQLQDFIKKVPPFDIVIDDGSHDGLHQWTSFINLFPEMKSGGMYIIEDLLCSYDTRWNYPLNILTKIRDMVDQVQMSGAIPNSYICANKQEAVQKYHSDYFSEHIESIFVACGIVFIQKL